MSSLARARVLLICTLAVLVFCAARDASAQLDEHCTVSVLNRTVTVNPDGSWVLPNVPANFGLVRARATCIVNGQTISGESDLFAVPANGVVNLKPILFGQSTPIPTSLTVTASTQTLTRAGATLPLEVFAHYPDGALRNVTAASAGTQYTVSNPAIATVSADGLLQALTSGTVIVQATLEGASGLFSVRVTLNNTDTDGDGIPDDYELAHGLDPNNALDAQEDPDRDGFSNLQEFQLGTDPHGGDADGDGLSDGDEANIYHTNPLLADTDGDGIPDGVEVQTGSNPLDRNSYNLSAATASSIVSPSPFVLTTSVLFPVASRLLSWRVTLIDQKTTLDLTADSSTSFSSSNLTICNFGAEKGRVFAGSPGSCVITITNGTLSATALGIVESFTPTALSYVDIPGFANNVDVAGDLVDPDNEFAYVAAGSAGLQIVDVGNHRGPSIVASLALAGNANDVVVAGGYAYVAGGSAGLLVVNVQNPRAPALAGSLNPGGVAWDVVVKGGRAYVANGSNGLLVADVTSPTAPVALGGLSLAGTTKGVDVDLIRQIAVVARGTAGMSVINVANPAAPTLLATLTGGDVRDVAISGNYAFLADFSRSLTSVDITNPLVPILRASTPIATGGRLQDVALTGTVAAGADVFFVNGVPLSDVSNPASPQPRAILDFGNFRDDNGTGIAMDGQYVYLTAAAGAISENGITGTSRLYIGQYLTEDQNGVAPTVTITSPTAGLTVIEGSVIPVRVHAGDDVAVAAVNFLVNGQVVFTDTTFPYEFNVTVPAGASTLTLGATAVDLGGNVGVAQDVQETVIPDPLTTVVGRVIDRSGVPVAGATVTLLTFTTTTASDGTFTIGNVPTASGSLFASASAVIGGGAVRGRSAGTPPVLAGITNVGDIRLLAFRILLLYADVEADTARSRIAAAATLAGLFTAQDIDTFRVGCPGCGGFATPTLAQLLNYGAVMVWSNYPFFDNTALGNVLADYVDQGGGVVTSSMSHSGVYAPDGIFRGLAGRLVTGGYIGFVPGGSQKGTTVLSLANSNLSHPLMQGVVGTDYFNADFTGYTVTPGSTVIARDTANYPKVAIGPIGHVVSIAFYVGYRDTLNPPDAAYRLFANALNFVRAKSD